MIDLTPTSLDARILSEMHAGEIRLKGLLGEGGYGSVQRFYSKQLGRELALKLMPLVSREKSSKSRNAALQGECLLGAKITPASLHYIGAMVAQPRGHGAEAQQFSFSEAKHRVAVFQNEEDAYLTLAQSPYAKHFVRCHGATMVYINPRRGEESYALALCFDVVDEQPLDLLDLSSKDVYDQLAKVGTHLASNLRRLHILGIAHGDVKTENIIGSKLVDFGLSRIQRSTRTSQIRELLEHEAYVPPGPLTTPEFSAPEHWGVDGLTLQTDLYSSGLTLTIARDPGFWNRKDHFAIASVICYDPEGLRNRATRRLKEKGAPDGFIAGVHELLDPEPQDRSSLTYEEWAHDHLGIPLYKKGSEIELTPLAQTAQVALSQREGIYFLREL